MRRLRGLVALMALLGALGLAVGCTESSEEDARTPEGAATVANTAVQTDEEGNTVTAPVTPPREEPPAEPGEPAAGDAAAGRQVFSANCQSCHLNGGQDAGGVGPQLAGQGLTADVVTETVTNGRGAMPGGLVSGDDLTNVVAYVVSIQ